MDGPQWALFVQTRFVQTRVAVAMLLCLECLIVLVRRLARHPCLGVDTLLLLALLGDAGVTVDL